MWILPVFLLAGLAHGQLLQQIVANSNPGVVGSMGSLVQKLVGTGSGQSGTCGTSGATTCVATGTVSSGHTLLIVSITASGRTISSTNCGGTLNTVPGINLDGLTNLEGQVMQRVWITGSSGCTNPTVTYSGTHGGATIAVYDYNPTGGTPVLDSYGSGVTSSAAGSPFNGQALTTTGSSIVNLENAYASGSSGVTAVASPYNTNFESMTNNNFYNGGASTYTTNATPSWTAGSNTAAMWDGLAIGFGVTASRDWTFFDWHSEVAGSVPTLTTLAGDVYGYVGGGNSTGNPALTLPGNGTTGLVGYSDSTQCGTLASVRYSFGGVTTAGSNTKALVWKTGTATHGQLVWQPPNNTTQVSFGYCFYTNIPNSENSGTAYSGASTRNSTDIMDVQILPNTGTSLPIILECNGSNVGTIYNSTSGTYLWITGQFISTNGGTNTVDIYNAAGTTLLGSKTCTNTTTAQITAVGLAGISGGETESGTNCSGSYCIIEVGAMKIDRTGAHFPMLPQDF